MTYKPDGWQLVKVTPKLVKVFGVWRGDNWRLNSGVKSIQEVSGVYTVNGYSGSVYELTPDGEGALSGYGHGVLNNFVKQGNDAGHHITLLTMAELKEQMPELFV